MRYLIVFKDGGDPFYTQWFQYENHFIKGMIVFDFSENKWTDDGVSWQEIKIDHL